MQVEEKEQQPLREKEDWVSSIKETGVGEAEGVEMEVKALDLVTWVTGEPAPAGP